MLEQLELHFPRFYRFAQTEWAEVYDVLPPETEEGIQRIEASLEMPLPDSYRRFLLCTRGFRAMGHILNFGPHHPFLVEFPSRYPDSSWLLRVLKLEPPWPPPSQGMLCFGDYWLEEDGDDVLFDVSHGLISGEYPVMYYAHGGGSVDILADSFGEWLEHLGDGVPATEQPEADATVWPPPPNRQRE